MHTLPTDFGRQTRGILLSFPGQAIGEWHICRGEDAAEELWFAEADISVSHGLVRGSDNKYLELLFVLSKWADGFHAGQADVILANSKFTARVTMDNFSSLKTTPKIVYPGINIEAYKTSWESMDPDVVQVSS